MAIPTEDLEQILESAILFDGFTVLDIWGVCPGRYTKRNRLTPKIINESISKLVPADGPVAGLAARVNELLADPGRARAMGLAGRARAISVWDPILSAARTNSTVAPCVSASAACSVLTPIMVRSLFFPESKTMQATTGRPVG